LVFGAPGVGVPPATPWAWVTALIPHERGSLLITTNQVVTQWGTVFGDDVLAAAILDRLLHHSHTLMIQGESYRLK
jgi:DNA replication protein DnaC